MARTRRRGFRRFFVLAGLGAAVAAWRERQLKTNEERFFGSR
jgi:hypothetical protein